MAIDDAEKRKSVAGIPYLPLGINVTPNASKDQEWRQQASWSYSGILAGSAVAEEETINYHARVGFPAVRGYSTTMRLLK